MQDEQSERSALAVIGRCSGPAWELLKRFREAPYFNATIKALAQKQGTIFEHDVEQALSEAQGRRHTRGGGRSGSPSSG